MLTQYWSVKRNHLDAIVFYRMGDFYEMFFEDAQTAAPLLGLQLTAREKGSEHPVAMCGVPHHAVMSYAQKLVLAGKKVAICEQMEPATPGRGLVRREVLRIVTPGLIADPSLVPEERGNYLYACVLTESGLRAAAFDLLAQNVRAADALDVNAFLESLREDRPSELLTNRETAKARWFHHVAEELPEMLVTVRDGYFLSGSPARAIAQYLVETQKMTVGDFEKPAPLVRDDVLRLDSVALKALEVLEPRLPGSPTLAGTLDRTRTPMGRRLLREWLARPLKDRATIERRQDAVAALKASPCFAEALQQALKPIGDLERVATKTEMGLASPRDLGALGAMLAALPAVRATLAPAPEGRLREIASSLDLLEPLRDELASRLLDELPNTHKEGGIFREETHPDLAELRALARDAKSVLAALENRERERTGIPSLKVKYSRVFGYTIEVTTPHLAKVPKEYRRKQTIAGGERFVTEELAVLEEKITRAEERLRGLEESLFLELRGRAASHGAALRHNARLLAELDVLGSFARVAMEYDYCRPAWRDDGRFVIEDGRHPVLEQWLPSRTFVPNSVDLSSDGARTLVITGPNMGGKSTFLRQTALIALLAQAGSYVPARRAELPLLDAIFTRIGSGDDLARGRSTFMVEMAEMARIVEQATERSLVVVDEIGRGTSTYDGLALATAIVEHLHTRSKARTLFATHFHELTRLAERLRGVGNRHVLVERWNDELKFVHRVVPGAASRSYGVEVAKLAGLPASLLRRAEQLCGQLERQAALWKKATLTENDETIDQLPLFAEVVGRETLPAADSESPSYDH
jgi:DNA mismatch repair protein MutS